MKVIHQAISILVMLATVVVPWMGTNVSAVPRTYYIRNVKFDEDGTEVNGTFGYDDEDVEYYDIDISSSWADYAYVSAELSDATKIMFLPIDGLLDLQGQRFLRFFFDGPLSGDEVTTLTVVREAICDSVDCSRADNDDERWDLNSFGYVTTDPTMTVPVASPTGMPSITGEASYSDEEGDKKSKGRKKTKGSKKSKSKKSKD